MQKTFTLLASVAVIALSTAAFAADKEAAKSEATIEHKDNGGFEKMTKQEHTDAAGTTQTEKAKTELSVSDDGSSKKTVETETTTDPKGLMNKQKTKTKQVVKTDKAGKTMVETKKTVNGDTVEDSTTAR